jgi:hypothetical protein
MNRKERRQAAKGVKLGFMPVALAKNLQSRNPSRIINAKSRRKSVGTKGPELGRG